MAGETISRAEFARRLKLTRGRVTQMCQAGMPSTADGQIDPAQAIPWIRENVASWRWSVRRPTTAHWPEMDAKLADLEPSADDWGEIEREHAALRWEE